PVAPVGSGTSYQISAGNGQYLAQSGTNLVTSNASSTAPAQRWNFAATSDGFFTVTNAGSGQALGVGTGDAGRAWGAAATISTLTSSVGQQWSIQTVVS